MQSDKNQKAEECVQQVQLRSMSARHGWNGQRATTGRAMVHAIGMVCLHTVLENKVEANSISIQNYYFGWWLDLSYF